MSVIWLWYLQQSATSNTKSSRLANFSLGNAHFLSYFKFMRYFYFFTAILIVSAYCLTSCTTVPITGRSALHLVSSQQLAAMAATQFGELKKQSRISNNPKYTAMLKRVGERIASVVDASSLHSKNMNWEFVVFEDPDQINAFAMPGGKVAVYTGLFDVVQTDADLAIVVGHEIAHVVAGHGAERFTQQLLAAGGAMALSYGTNDLDNSNQQMIMVAYGATTTLGALLPYSRLHETEADEIGLIFSARAGYDPRVAVDFWKRMDAANEGRPPEFLSTHPADATRQHQLTRVMPLALQEYYNSKL